MYLKLIGSFLLVISAAVIGILKADELKERVELLKELRRMMVLLQGELRFHRGTLAETFENVAERMSEPFSTFLKKVSIELESKASGSFESIWEEMSGKYLSQKKFFKEDGWLLESLGGSFGYLDITMQTEQLNLVILQVEDVMEYAKEQLKVKGKLYQTMGVTAGAFLALLII